MDLKQLRQLVVSIEAGSIVRAADRLHMTQPALTRSIRNLEYELGAQLLERSARGVVPTEFGRLLYERGQALLAESDKLKADVARLTSGKGGGLAIGVGALSEGWVLPVLADFSRANPSLELNTRVGFFDELAARLITSEIDLVISIMPTFLRGTEFTIEQLGELRSSFLVRRDHPLADAPEVTASVMTEYGWAVFDVPNTTRFFQDNFFKRGLGLPRVQIKSNSVAMIRSVLLATNSIGVLPDYLAGTDGELVALKSSFGEIRNPFCAVYTSALQRSQPARKFLAALKDAASDRCWG